MKLLVWVGVLAVLPAGGANGQPVATPSLQAAQPASTQTPEQIAAQAERRAQREREARAREARQARAVAAADRVLARWTIDRLSPFRDEADFDAYLTAVRSRQAAEYASVNVGRIQIAEMVATGQQSDTPAVPVCAPTDKDCQNRRDENDEGEQLTVTGSRVVTPPLTNNQEQGVDEGDVVKQIGQYLLVLQDGRIFVVDTEAGPGRNELRLVDRADVYRDAGDEAWYDELVVEGERIVVTGYAYEANASEIAVFRLGEGGRLAREGVFRIESEDYYDRNNYASRLIGDELILYTPLPIREREEDAPFRWPTLRRASGAASGGRELAGTQLLRPQGLYRPLSTLSEPAIHMVTRCQLGEYRPGSDLGCTSQGFVASRSRQFYVAGGYAYLWSEADDSDWDYDLPFCAVGFRPARRDAGRSIVHRVSLSGAPLTVTGAVGAPFDQLGMDASGGRFRALTAWWTNSCQAQKGHPLVYFEVGEAAFGTRLRPAPDSAFTPLPAIGAAAIENRFTDRFLVYGGRSVFGRRYFGGDEEGTEGTNGAGDAVAVPIGNPASAVRVPLRHRVWRVERAGDNAVLTGYDDASGLDVSVIDLRGAAPRLADTLRLEGRYESEGRSHAFNSLIDGDGSGLIGLPTVLRVGDSDRRSWRSEGSDVSFLALGAGGRLESLGALETRAEEGRYYDYGNRPADPNVYSCEVSCIDWYGNSRPLFTRGRVFALTATELVEGRVADGRIGEVRRIDLTKELPEHLRRARAAE